MLIDEDLWRLFGSDPGPESALAWAFAGFALVLVLPALVLLALVAGECLVTRTRPLAVLAVLALAGLSPAAEPVNPYAGEQASALADARRLDPVTASLTRYLSFAQVPAELRGEARRVVNLWANSLSREADFARPRRVTETVFAVNVLDYGWDPQTWEQLAGEDPYYHVQVDLVVGKKGQKRYFPAEGKDRAGWYEVDVLKAVRVPAIAPWLPALDAAELVARCQSAAPIVRADWWFSRAAIQFGRKGTGYYDWLRLKKLADFDELIAFDRKVAERVRKQVAAIVARSGVSNFPRQLFIEGAVNGERAESRDQVADNKDARNALRQLDGDYKPTAFEIYGFLANGLFCFFLANGDGERQDSAPDGIGSDKTAPGNDGKIHVGLSCVRCHVEGFRPINDWARKVYAPPNSLNSPDPERHRRLVQLYLGELQEKVDDANARYARALKRLTGWKPDEAAKAVGDLWKWYVERDYLPADAAAELGVKEADYLDRLRAYYKANQLADPVLASHIANPPLPIRSDDWEQLQPIVVPVVLGTPGGGK